MEAIRGALGVSLFLCVFGHVLLFDLLTLCVKWFLIYLTHELNGNETLTFSGSSEPFFVRPLKQSSLILFVF